MRQFATKLQEADIFQDVVLYQLVPRHCPIFLVVCFGKRFRGNFSFDWTITQDNKEVLSNVEEILRALGGKFYALNTFEGNTRRTPRRLLTTEIVRGLLFGNKQCPGDTVVLEQNEGKVLSSAGCGFMLTEGPQSASASHVGWRSLINTSRAHNAPPPWRLDESVTDAVVRGIGFCHAKDTRVWLRGFIQPRLLPFPLRNSEWAEKNKLLRDFVVSSWGKECVEDRETEFYLRLPILARNQLAAHGVREICTESAYLPADGLWNDGRKGLPRNLSIALRL